MMVTAMLLQHRTWFQSSFALTATTSSSSRPPATSRSCCFPQPPLNETLFFFFLLIPPPHLPASKAHPAAHRLPLWGISSNTLQGSSLAALIEDFRVLRILQGLVTNLLELLGINCIREIKLIHSQSLGLLDHMCEVIKHSDGIDMEDLCGGAIFQAVELGVFEFIDRIFQTSPDLVWSNNQNKRNPLQFAIECRQERIYSLIYRLDKTERNVIGNLADTSNSNMLHMAAMLSPLAKLDNISGAALQMQRELQWFKEVETIVLPRMRDILNDENLTPRALFTKNHKELVKEGERWMKETATSCTVVGALIITIMFASAFTVPGGNNGETGIPIFLEKKLFMVFIISDAISLFSSTTSVLMFLGILTSRYAENDFLKSLPTKMIIGLSTLFISIAAMMVAFSSGLFIMIHEQSWIVIPIIFLASVPVTLFIWMQFPLLIEIFISTYGRGIFDRNVKP
ncbi:hypothetical protein L3X38_011749 [Prunus dulcis]|uniref:PGG domain-containing protein n=1 Tax=Prunus dulcis TaxID=3755 RepID=A0AAD4WIS3_PRUDU|nr:hypothetical protein L3X38_011749 [Prunus dulcis]